MSFREWINAIRRQVASPGEPENECTRWRKALSDFGYPYDLVSAASANEALASAQIAGRDNGFVPVVIVPGHWNSTRIAPARRAMRAQEMAHEAFDAAYGRQFLADGVLAMYDDLEIDPENPNPDDFDRLKPVKCDAPVSGLSVVKRWDQVAIVRVPAASAEELPAYFEWGGWNAVPDSQTIVAVARHWKETYGAELVAMGPDLLEFHVARKPQNHAATIALLKEFYVFASDSLDFHNLSALAVAASELRVSSSWVFWWD